MKVLLNICKLNVSNLIKDQKFEFEHTDWPWWKVKKEFDIQADDLMKYYNLLTLNIFNKY